MRHLIRQFFRDEIDFLTKDDLMVFTVTVLICGSVILYFLFLH